LQAQQPTVLLSDSTGVIFPQDTTIVTCNTNVPLIFNVEGCPNAKAYWKYYDEKNQTQVDTLSESLAVGITITLYVSCIDDQPFSPNKSGLSLDITVQLTPAKPNLQLTNNSIVQCLTDEKLYIDSGCDARYAETIWQDGSKSQQYKLTQDGIYSAQCVNLCGIGSEADTIVVNIADSFKDFKPNITATQTLICGSETATIFLDNPRLPERFIDNSIFEVKFNVDSSNPLRDSVITVSQPGNYFISYTSQTCGTVYSDTISISNGTSPPLIIATRNFICGDGFTIIRASGCQGTVKWSNGATGDSISVSQSAAYNATCENSCGVSERSDELLIKQSEVPIGFFILPSKTYFCTAGEEITLSVSDCDGAIKWNTGEIANEIQTTQTGTYSATCTNACGSVEPFNTVNLQLNTFPPVISTAKSSICAGETTTLEISNCLSSITVWNTGDTLRVLTVNKAGIYYVQCLNECDNDAISNIITITESFKTSPPIITANQTQICDGEFATMVATSCSDGSVKWNTGQTLTQINVSQAGTYTAICESSCGISELSNEIRITTSTKPDSPIITVNKTIICSGEMAILTVSNCVNGAITWSTGETTQVIQVEAGAYTAVCENACGVSELSEIIIQRNNSSSKCLPITTTLIRN
jgi:hypothetical protein